MAIYTDESLHYLLKIREETDLVWKDITKDWNDRYGEKLGKKTLNALRKKYGKIRVELREVDSDEFDESLIAKVLAKAHTKDKSNKILTKQNKLILDESLTAQEFLAQLSEINRRAPIKTHAKVKLAKIAKPKRALVVHISDTHIGCNIDKDELNGVNEFNNVIAARRFAFLFKTIAEYKKEYRKDTELVLVLNGDIFAGVIHSQEIVDPMSTQFASGLRIFAQGISFLAQHFNNIRIVCCTGNHDRYVHKMEKGRQSEQKWDSFATNLYCSLREKFNTNSNISFYIPNAPYALFYVMGHRFMATHGDTVINLGNPHKSVNIESLTKQVNNVIASLKIDIDVLLVGHVHKRMFFSLSNGVDVAMNGTLSGTDGFAQSIGVFGNQTFQQMFEVTKEHKMGDMRFVDLCKADNDKSLEKIVEPLRGKF